MQVELAETKGVYGVYVGDGVIIGGIRLYGWNRLVKRIPMVWFLSTLLIYIPRSVVLFPDGPTV